MRESMYSNIPALILLFIIVIMSLVLFAAMGIDKRRAQRERWRIPEARLMLLALLGGSTGGWIGMAVFHHKTRHLKFKILFPLLALAQLAGLLYLFIK